MKCLAIHLSALVGLLALTSAAIAADAARINARPTFSTEVAHDVSRPLSSLARVVPKQPSWLMPTEDGLVDIRPERGPIATGRGTGVDGSAGPTAAASIAAPSANFEGLSNQDNFNLFGFRVNPPDPVGAVGPNHYVQMINLVFAVYSKTGTLLVGPTDTGTLWARADA